jgi:hypothetical protein
VQRFGALKLLCPELDAQLIAPIQQLRDQGVIGKLT